MTKNELTQYQKRRFIQNGHRCEECGELISNTEELIFIKKYVGKFIKYYFYHKECYNGEKEEQT